MSNNILEDLADRYDRTWNLDPNIKTISYPPNGFNENGKAFGPMMNKMKEKMRLNSAVFDRTLSRASVIKINIANGIENNETIGRARNMLTRGSTQIGHLLTYVGMGKATTIPIAHKVRERHLELEPLCCLSSCLVRGGCTTVVVFEIIYVILTLFACSIKFYDGGRWKFWEEIEPNFNAVVTHRLFLYIIIIFDIITTIMVLILLRGLFLFDRLLVKRHWRFDFFALGFNVFAFIFFLLGVSSQGPETWSFVNILMV
uniref:Chitin synthase n=1 Tax=Panagrolaimus sp. PS1159 TaxID=55785 RepID=A0AC35GJ71_9BILA